MMTRKNYLKIALIFTLAITTNNSFGQSVVINEIVTDPQQDWSTNNFNGIVGASAITITDEYIELYIKTAGLDLTGWTIELNDTTPSSGNLTSTGAFDVSNYSTSGSGTFTNTEIGDFLILGNPNGATAMNNSITINLKNSIGTLIDTVTIGIDIGEAPSGKAGNLGNESVQRIPNGADTNTDAVDFSKGIASLGSINPTQVSWDGISSSDWATTTNWATGTIPLVTDDVVISSGLTNYPTISTGTSVSVNSITINSGASLIAESTSTLTGTVTYNRIVNFVSGNLNGWYLMTSPVVGQDYNDAYVTANDIASNGSNRGIATYNSSAPSWSYLQGTGTGTFYSGKGYSIKRNTVTGTISFSGTINTSDSGVDFILDNASTRINLLGNPYTSYISSATFLGNAALSETQTMWIYDQTSGTHGTYTVKTLADNFILAPGQGFFVTANTAGGTVNFSEANQTHNITDTFQKGIGDKTEIKLIITDGTINNYSKIYYLENATTGFDVGYEGESFSGTSNHFAIYSHLISDSKGKNYQVQSLPNSDYENMVIPVGMNADAGKEITFSAEASNLPSAIKVFLEDRETNSFTRLDEVNTNYKVTLTKAANGIGRFFLHTSTKSTLHISNIDLENISIYKTNNSNLRIVGLSAEKATVKLFNLLGKQVLNTAFNSNGVQDILLPKLATGIYIVQLETATGKRNKKITL